MPETVLFVEGARPLPDSAEVAAAARAEALRRSRAVDGAVAEELLRRGWRQAGDGEGIQWCVSCGQGTVWIDPTGQPRHHACARHVPSREDGLVTYRFSPVSAQRFLQSFGRAIVRLEAREPSPEDRAARDLHDDADRALVDVLDGLEWPPTGPLVPEGVERLVVAPEWATKKKRTRKKKAAKGVLEAVADAATAEALDVAEAAMSEPPSRDEVAEAMRDAAEAARAAAEAAEASRDAAEAAESAAGATGAEPATTAPAPSGAPPAPEAPLSALGLPQRAANALAKRGIETVGALMALTEADVASTKGLGKSSFAEVKAKLAGLGIVLEAGEAPAPKKRAPKKKPTEVSIPAAPERDEESAAVAPPAPPASPAPPAPPATEAALGPQSSEPQAAAPPSGPSLADALVPEPPSFASDFADAGVDWS